MRELEREVEVGVERENQGLPWPLVGVGLNLLSLRFVAETELTFVGVEPAAEVTVLEHVVAFDLCPLVNSLFLDNYDDRPGSLADRPQSGSVSAGRRATSTIAAFATDRGWTQKKVA